MKFTLPSWLRRDKVDVRAAQVAYNRALRNRTTVEEAVEAAREVKARNGFGEAIQRAMAGRS